MKKHTTYNHKASRIIAGIIAVICVWSLAGHALWNITRQACYQYVHHIKQERSFRDTIVLHQHTFQDADIVVWVKEQEIRYAGNMFDIKHSTLKGDSIILVGHYDDFENELYKSLQGLFDKEDSNPKQASYFWLTIVAILPTEVNNFSHTYVLRALHTNCWQNNFRHTVCIPPLQNPPDTFV